MCEARARIFGSESTPGSASAAMGCDLRDDELVTYPDDDHGDDWGFADVPIDYHVDVRASHRGDFDAICE